MQVFCKFEWMQLRKVLFWDTNPDLIDYEKHANYIIQRVVTCGQLEEWREVIAYYGVEKIKNTVVELRDLDDKTMTYLSVYFSLPKEIFRCFRK